MVLFQYKKGEIILKPKEFLKNLYFCVEGELTFTPEDKKIPPFSIQQGYNFGEKYLVPKSRLRKPVGGTLTMKRAGSCFQITVKELKRLLHNDLELSMASFTDLGAENKDTEGQTK